MYVLSYTATYSAISFSIIQLGHDRFMECYIRTLQQLMLKDETQPFANAGLKFMANMATSYDGEDVHPILTATFQWLLGVSTFR